MKKKEIHIYIHIFFIMINIFIQDLLNLHNLDNIKKKVINIFLINDEMTTWKKITTTTISTTKEGEKPSSLFFFLFDKI